jgi:hypothetical protein
MKSLKAVAIGQALDHNISRYPGQQHQASEQGKSMTFNTVPLKIRDHRVVLLIPLMQGALTQASKRWGKRRPNVLLAPNTDWQACTFEQSQVLREHSPHGLAVDLSDSARAALGASPPLPSASEASLMAQSFALSESARVQFQLDNGLAVALSESASQRFNGGVKSVEQVTLNAQIGQVLLRLFSTGHGQISVEFTLTNDTLQRAAEPLLAVLEFVYALEHGLRIPKRQPRITICNQTLHAALLQWLQPTNGLPLQAAMQRAYTLTTVCTTGECDEDIRRAWVYRLAHRQNNFYGVTVDQLAQVHEPAKRIRMDLAPEGAAWMLWHDESAEPSHYAAQYIQTFWQKNEIPTVLLALHERAILRWLADGTTAPVADDATRPAHVEHLTNLRSALVRYRLNYRVIEISQVQRTNALWQRCRETFLLDTSLEVLEADLSAGVAQMQLQSVTKDRRRWGWIKVVGAGFAAAIALWQVVEIVRQNWFDHHQAISVCAFAGVFVALFSWYRGRFSAAE